MSKETCKRDLLTVSTVAHLHTRFVYIKKGPHKRPTISKVAQLHCQPLPLSCLVRTKQRKICQKRPEYIKKDLQQRPTDISTLAQLNVSPCPYPESYVLSTAKYVERDLYASKEACKRDLLTISQVVHHHYQPLPLSSLVRTGHRQICHERTYINQKRPTTESK